ncbi:hypothetical protein [Puniceibacterium sp. IMCC21224]|uniref:hypothetical protein n=1 Tax=Puniceibacterium sp. IMCC21224 TaxID=1618204 RepID=UPI00064D9F75|nr:hypothetical protein [Puniceibacterium sp. IMCC21224]KMK64908.1 hypothetical protein IMCC21224_12153 [Puniceibacterium sp. IMCC21224]
MTEPTQALRARLDRLAAARGFLLPHHGALAVGAPELHDAYLQMYNALTVAPRVLSAHERECVWLGILIAVEEHVGTHHLELFRQADGTDAEAEAVIALTGQAASLSAFRFAARSFPDHLPALDPTAAYDRCIAALRGPLPVELAGLVLLSVQAARGDRDGVAHHLRMCYAEGLAEDAMVEALSYLIWPRGVNCFLDACEVWHGLMVAGEVTPSERFAVWRDMPGQGAFRAANGARVAGFDEEPG